MQPSPSRLVRATTSVLAVLLLIAWLHPATAAPPATNDACADATLIPGNGPFPHLTPVVDVFTATTNNDPALGPVAGRAGGRQGAHIQGVLALRLGRRRKQ